MVFRKEDGPAAYTYAAVPKSLPRKAKQQNDEPPPPANIMFDRRVIRGNTYAAQVLPAVPTVPQLPTKPRPRRKVASRKPAALPPVPGRQHIDIQTEHFLEEVTDIQPEEDAVTQTDPFLERPITPLFVPQKRGVDTETQIEDGELFDFDFEVEPLLEVLVGKTLEQGLMEVLEEEELTAMRAHQEHFEQVRNAELVATQRMEQAERRKVEEKERRLQQERERLERERVVREKVAAATFARGFLTGMVDSVISSLWTQGYFYDAVERSVKEDFMPWLRGAVDTELSRWQVAREALAKLVANVGGMAEGARARKRAERRAQRDALERVQAARKEEAASSAAEAAAAERGRATYILNELKPRIAAPGKIAAVRTELEAKAEEAVNSKWEELKGAAGDAARKQAEADIAAAAERKPADEATDPDAVGVTPEVDVERLVANAMAAVPKPEATAVSDEDVLNAMIEADAGLKTKIVKSLALEKLGPGAWIYDPRFEDEITPAEAEA